MNNPTQPIGFRNSDNVVQAVDAAHGLPVQGLGYVSVVTVTRPANTTAYTAGDVIGIDASGSAGSAILTFSDIGPSGGHIIITGAELRIDKSSVPSGMTSFRLYLYSASPDAILDNAAWDLSSTTDRGLFRGYIDLGTPVDLGSTLFVQTEPGFLKQFKLATGSTALYGELVTNGAWTPASGDVFTVKMRGVAV